MRQYYQKTTVLDAKLPEYYRYFESPGLGHCAGGVGSYPKHLLGDLIDWVENGKKPDVLQAGPNPYPGLIQNNRPLCAWPRRQYTVEGATSGRRRISIALEKEGRRR
jgi:hypothetical protein